MTRGFVRYVVSLFFLGLFGTTPGWCISIGLTRDGAFTEAQWATITSARDYWASNLISYKEPVAGLNVSISVTSLAGEVYGGYDNYAESTHYYYTAHGFVNLATTSPSLYDDARHEIAHALGFGTLWYNGNDYPKNVVLDSTNTKYIGAGALQDWKTEFGYSKATYVPLDLDENGYTGHWDGYFDPRLDRELMVPWIYTDGSYVSHMTLSAFSDIGYNVAAVPEPGSLALLAGGLVFAFARKRLVGRRSL